MSLEAEAERGRLAQDVLENPVYAGAYEQIEQGLIQLWRDARDKAQREEAHQLLRMLDKVRQSMESAMRTGQVAVSELQRKRTLAERIGLRPASD